MAWKTTVVWDMNHTLTNDLNNQISIGLFEKYKDFIDAKNIAPYDERSTIDDINHQVVSRFWADEEAANFYMDNIVQYLIDHGITPVSKKIEFVPE